MSRRSSRSLVQAPAPAWSRPAVEAFVDSVRRTPVSARAVLSCTQHSRMRGIEGTFGVGSRHGTLNRRGPARGRPPNVTMPDGITVPVPSQEPTPFSASLAFTTMRRRWPERLVP